MIRTLRTAVRTGVAAAFALAFGAGAALADKLPLSAVSQYLNGIGSAQTTFTQINPDGTIATGTLMIKRPGKVRFDYDPPEESMVLASSGAVYVIDGKMRGQPHTYPLSSTPLSVILAPRVDLSRNGMVVAHDYDGTSTVVTAQDPERPEYGSIRLHFTDDPVELRQWVIRDAEGGETTVILNALQETALPDRRFWIDSVLNER